jgi:hypothetical protein
VRHFRVSVFLYNESRGVVAPSTYDTSSNDLQTNTQASIFSSPRLMILVGRGLLGSVTREKPLQQALMLRTHMAKQHTDEKATCQSQRSDRLIVEKRVSRSFPSYERVSSISTSHTPAFPLTWTSLSNHSRVETSRKLVRNNGHRENAKYSITTS